MVPAGTILPPPIGTIATTMCRVAGSIKPTSDSDIKFEVWDAGHRLEREIPLGGGGRLRRSHQLRRHQNRTLAWLTPAAPRIQATSVARQTSRPAIRRSDRLRLAWKHLQAARSKDIIRAFYGEPVKHSYFSSCSNGGRQALMEIHAFQRTMTACWSARRRTTGRT